MMGDDKKMPFIPSTTASMQPLHTQQMQVQVTTAQEQA